MLRRIVVHWIFERRLARLKAEFAATWRVRARRAQERRMADDEAWRKLAGMTDDDGECAGDPPCQHSANRPALHRGRG